MSEKSQGKSPLDSARGTTIVEEPVVTGIVSSIVQQAKKTETYTGGTRVSGDSSPTAGELFSGLTDGNRDRA